MLGPFGAELLARGSERLLGSPFLCGAQGLCSVTGGARRALIMMKAREEKATLRLGKA